MRLEEARTLSDRLMEITDRRNDLLRVSIYGGPGSGKSTTRAESFAILKKDHVEIEEVGEVAKDYTWEKATGKLGFQPLMMAKQMWRERRLEGQVDVIITDTSTLLSLVYGSDEHGVTPEFRAWIIAEYRKALRLDFFLNRNTNIPYNPNGRSQKSFVEAEEYDYAILRLLDEVGMPYHQIHMDGFASQKIANKVIQTLAIMGKRD